MLEDLDGAGRHAARLVREAVLAAQVLDRGADLGQVVPRQRREQVMLDLVVQPACDAAAVCDKIDSVEGRHRARDRNIARLHLKAVAANRTWLHNTIGAEWHRQRWWHDYNIEFSIRQVCEQIWQACKVTHQ